jgi:hypothetical protein
MPINPRITIYKTVGEWEIINSRIKEIGKKTIQGYMTSKVHEVTTGFIKNPKNVTSANGKKKAKQFPVEYSTYLILKELSEIMQRPVDSIIDDLVIVPLLSPKP